jgi:exodeoxyribonuclease VII small subunit
MAPLQPLSPVVRSQKRDLWPVAKAVRPWTLWRVTDNAPCPYAATICRFPDFPPRPSRLSDFPLPLSRFSAPFPALPACFGKELKSRPRPAWYAGVEAENKLAKLTFEAALAKLESTVESMESGQVPLAELVAKFEEGNKLLKQCEARLKDAEMKIEQLKKQKDGVAFAPFDPERGS